MDNRSRAGRAPALAALAFVLVSMGMAAGCGSSAKVDTRSTSVGQELQDLDNARNKGLLTEDEYNTQREKIIKKR